MNQRSTTTSIDKHEEALSTYNPPTSTNNSQDSAGSTKVTPDRSPLKRKIKPQPVPEGSLLSPLPRGDSEVEYLSSPNHSYQHRYFPSTPQYDHIYAAPEASPYSPFPLIALSATPTHTPKRVRLADDVVVSKSRPRPYSPPPKYSYPPSRRAYSHYPSDHTPRVGLPMTETQRKAALDVEKFHMKEHHHYSQSYSLPHPGRPYYQHSPKSPTMAESKGTESIPREGHPEPGPNEDMKATAESSHLIETESNGRNGPNTAGVKEDLARDESGTVSKDDSQQSMKTSPPRNTTTKEDRAANLITPSEGDGRKSASYTYDSAYAGDSPYKSAPSQPGSEKASGSSYYTTSTQGGQYRYPPSSPVTKNSAPPRGHSYNPPPPPPPGGAHGPYYGAPHYYHPNSYHADPHYYEGSRGEKRASAEEGRRSEGQPSHPYYSAPSVTESFDSDSHHHRDRSPSKRPSAPPILKSSSYEGSGRHSRHSSGASYGNIGEEYSHEPPHPSHRYGHQPPYPPHIPKGEYYRSESYPPHRYPPEYNPGPPPGASEAYYDRASYDYYAGREPGAEYYYSYPPHHQYAKDEVHPLMRDQYSDRDRRGAQEGLAPAGRAQTMSKTSTPQRKKVKGDDSVKTASSSSSSPKNKPSTKAQAAIAAGMTEPASAREVDFDIHNPPLHPQVPPSKTAVCPMAASVNNNDVLCGRGGGTNTQIGNRRFRSLVQEFQPTYLLCRRKEKPLIARTIVLIIRGRGGRFLKKDESNGALFEVGDEKAEAKTSQALREGLDVRSSKVSTPNSKKKKEKTPAKKIKTETKPMGGSAPHGASVEHPGHREGPPAEMSYAYPYYSGPYDGHYAYYDEHQPYTAASRKRPRPTSQAGQHWYHYPSPPPKGYNYPPPHQDYYQAFQPPQGPPQEENSVWEEDFSPPRPKKSKDEVAVSK